jgi:hypothetical protein
VVGYIVSLPQYMVNIWLMSCFFVGIHSLYQSIAVIKAMGTDGFWWLDGDDIPKRVLPLGLTLNDQH